MAAQKGALLVLKIGNGGSPESFTTLKNAWASGSLTNYQVFIPDFGTYQGAFQLTSLEYAGEFNGEVTYSVSLESSGNIAFST